MKNKCILKCVLFALVAFNSLAIMARLRNRLQSQKRNSSNPKGFGMMVRA